MMLRAGAIMIQYHGATVLRCYIAIGFNMLLGQQQAENRKRKLGLSSLELWLPSIGDSRGPSVGVQFEIIYRGYTVGWDGRYTFGDSGSEVGEQLSPGGQRLQ